MNDAICVRVVSCLLLDEEFFDVLFVFVQLALQLPTPCLQLHILLFDLVGLRLDLEHVLLELLFVSVVASVLIS